MTKAGTDLQTGNGTEAGAGVHMGANSRSSEKPSGEMTKLTSKSGGCASTHIAVTQAFLREQSRATGGLSSCCLLFRHWWGLWSGLFLLDHLIGNIKLQLPCWPLEGAIKWLPFSQPLEEALKPRPATETLQHRLPSRPAVETLKRKLPS